MFSDPSSITRLSPGRKPLGSKAALRLMDQLTAQQTSLVRAAARGDQDYLNHSYYFDPESGRRVAHELDEDELTRFAASWGAAPFDCTRAMNAAIRRIDDLTRRQRYVRAAVDLEILMDQEIWTASEGTIYQGIPPYLMTGYTDMGTVPSPTERNGREKIKVDKQEMRERLVACRWQAVATDGDIELLSGLYDAVRRDMQFNERGVDALSREFGSESIVLSEYVEKGLGVCRHLSILFQVYLQEAGIESRLVKGNLRFYIFSGRHAWNLTELGSQVVLADVTHPETNRPFLLVGKDEADVYERARECARYYEATPDEQNYYKIGA